MVIAKAARELANAGGTALPQTSTGETGDPANYASSGGGTNSAAGNAGSKTGAGGGGGGGNWHHEI